MIMISTNMNSKNKSTILIEEIAAEVQEIAKKPKSEQFSEAIENKLKASLIYYNNTTDLVKAFLQSKRDIRVLKALRKINKASNKAIIEKNMINQNIESQNEK